VNVAMSAPFFARPAAVCALAALAALAGGRALAAEAGDRKADNTPAAQKDATPSKEQVILDTLPETYRLPNGSVDHSALVAHEKRRAEAINKTLQAQFKVTETPHYLVLSDTDSGTSARFVKWCEVLYGNLCALFALDSRQRVWDGKCMLILFARRAKFQEFAQRFDHHDAKRAGAYFAVESYGPQEPRLVKILIPMDEKEPHRLQELFAHEGTHAFFELYRSPGHLPLWLHEGLAEYMVTVNDQSLRSARVTEATRIAKTGRSIRKVFAAKAGDELEWGEYCVSFTLVDFLITSGKPKFKQFIDALKDGQEQEAALTAAYGFSLSELDKQWRTHVLEYIPKHS
jgi:hypothetical protein